MLDVTYCNNLNVTLLFKQYIYEIIWPWKVHFHLLDTISALYFLFCESRES